MTNSEKMDELEQAQAQMQTTLQSLTKHVATGRVSGLLIFSRVRDGGYGAACVVEPGVDKFGLAGLVGSFIAHMGQIELAGAIFSTAEDREKSGSVQ